MKDAFVFVATMVLALLAWGNMLSRPAPARPRTALFFAALAGWGALCQVL